MITINADGNYWGNGSPKLNWPAVVTTNSPVQVATCSLKKSPNSNECIACCIWPERCDSSLYPDLVDAFYYDEGCVAQCPSGHYSLGGKG